MSDETPNQSTESDAVPMYPCNLCCALHGNMGRFCSACLDWRPNSVLELYANLHIFKQQVQMAKNSKLLGGPLSTEGADPQEAHPLFDKLLATLTEAETDFREVLEGIWPGRKARAK